MVLCLLEEESFCKRMKYSSVISCDVLLFGPLLPHTLQNFKVQGSECTNILLRYPQESEMMHHNCQPSVTGAAMWMMEVRKTAVLFQALADEQHIHTHSLFVILFDLESWLCFCWSFLIILAQQSKKERLALHNIAIWWTWKLKIIIVVLGFVLSFDEICHKYHLFSCSAITRGWEVMHSLNVPISLLLSLTIIKAMVLLFY